MEIKLSYRYLIGFIFKLVVLLVLLEVSFRLLIPATEVPYFVFDSKEKILKFDNTMLKDGLYTFGSLAEIRARWHVNNMGWLSDRDYRGNSDKPVIAVIGNSYIEALQVNPDRTMTYNLRKKLCCNYEVYNFGISGAHLSQYLQMSRYVRNNFNPQVLIFNIIDGDILGSLMNSGNKPGNFYFSYGPTGVIETLIPYTPSKYALYYRKSALLRYVRMNNGMLGGASPSDSPSNSHMKDEPNNFNIFTNYAFGKIRQENPDCTVIIVMNAPMDDIYKGKIQNKNIVSRKIIANNAYNYGFHVVDLTTPMSELYAKNHLKFNFETNSHWNEYGHQVVADQIYQYIIKHRLVAPANNHNIKSY